MARAADEPAYRRLTNPGIDGLVKAVGLGALADGCRAVALTTTVDHPSVKPPAIARGA
ncbi:hypothetical protein ACH4A8_03955 [Streptomyces vietnamensis]|uniref:hypothetical protein n=1 Tax=Streptomyces vietnamensis TaxID=362257 RepID=UPI003434F183